MMNLEVADLLIRAILSRADAVDREAMQRFLERQRPADVGMDNFDRRMRRMDNAVVDDAQRIIESQPLPREVTCRTTLGGGDVVVGQGG